MVTLWVTLNVLFALLLWIRVGFMKLGPDEYLLVEERYRSPGHYTRNRDGSYTPEHIGDHHQIYLLRVEDEKDIRASLRQLEEVAQKYGPCSFSVDPVRLGGVPVVSERERAIAGVPR